MKQNPSYSDTDKPLRVRRGKVDSVDLYEVKENELEILSNGDTNSIFLNFAIFLLSLSFSSILSICTASFNKPIFQTLFLIITVVGGLGGIFLLFLWWKGRKSIQAIVKKIKDRIPQDKLLDNNDINDTEKPVVDKSNNPKE